MAKTFSLKDCTRPFTSDRQRDLVCAAINYFGDGSHPFADANTVGSFSAQYALECVGKGMTIDKRGTNEATERGKLLMEFHSRIEDKIAEADSEIFGDTVQLAEEAFWKVVAEQYKSRGVTTGDLPPSEVDSFREASAEAVGAWLCANRDAKKKRDQKSDAAKDDPRTPAQYDEHHAFADQWDPDRDFHARVVAALPDFHARVVAALPTFATLQDWRVTYEYPGYFEFRHKNRPNFTILATPDHEADGFIVVDAQTDDGNDLDLNMPDIEWPLAERLYEGKPNTTKAARVFLNLMSSMLIMHEPKKLVVEYDVTGWTDAQIGALSGEATAQAESNHTDDDDDHPDAEVIRCETVSL